MYFSIPAFDFCFFGALLVLAFIKDAHFGLAPSIFLPKNSSMGDFANRFLLVAPCLFVMSLANRASRSISSSDCLTLIASSIPNLRLPSGVFDISCINSRSSCSCLNFGSFFMRSCMISPFAGATHEYVGLLFLLKESGVISTSSPPSSEKYSSLKYSSGSVSHLFIIS